MKYQTPTTSSITGGRYNGNILTIDWKNSNDGVLRRYDYNYDGLNRLTMAHYREPMTSVPQNHFYSEEAAYDLNGNIVNLWRNTKNPSGVYEGIDILTYQYSGNKLTSVNDATMNPSGYPGGGNTIIYDDNGNMINHLDKGINQINYNFLNLTSNITVGSGRLRRSTNYNYRADGTKISSSFLNQTILLSQTDYLDGFQYKTIASNTILNFVPTSEGYFNFENNKYIYNYTDHLGNVRVSYFNNGSEIEVLEESNYYPFGLKHEGYNVLSGNPSYQYKYNGKELQETGMYDYGARMYMPDVGRWGVIDPLAEKMTRHSPYNYAFNNPIRFIDPDGRAPVDDHFNKFGRYIGTDNKSTNNVVVHTNSSATKLSQLKGNTGAASLSQLNYSNKGTTKAVSNILAHYAGEKGISEYTGTYSGSRGSAYTNDRGNIFFNIKDLGNGTYNNAYNIRSTLNHEGGKLGHKNENINPDDYTFVDHAKVYLNEAKNPDFGKTTQGYRYGQAASFGQRILNAAEKESNYSNNPMNMINDYNAGNTGGVTITPYSGGNNLPTGTIITVTVGNNTYPSKPYENIKYPQD